MQRSMCAAWVVGVACVLGTAGVAAAEDDRAGGEAGVRRPYVQGGLQSLEAARAYLRVAERRSDRDARATAREAGVEVEAAIEQAEAALAAADTRRTIAPGVAEPTDRPIRAAVAALRDATKSLDDAAEGGAKGADYQRHRGDAVRRAKLAAERLAPLAENERPIDPADPNGRADDRGGRDDVDPADLPRAVRATVAGIAPNLRVRRVRTYRAADADRAVTYGIDGSTPNGERVQFRVAEDGELLAMQRGDHRLGDDDARDNKPRREPNDDDE